MENKIVPLMISIFVGVILLGGVLIPIIGSANEEFSDIYNNPSGVLSKMSSGESVTIVVDVETGEITTNGVKVSPYGVAVISDLFVVSGGSGSILYNHINATEENLLTADVTIVLSGDGATISYNDVNDTYDNIGWCFYASLDGDYRTYPNASSSKEIYLNSIDQLYGSNWLATKSVWFSFAGEDVKVGSESIKADYTLNKVSGYDDTYTLIVGGGATGEFTFTYDEYVTHPRFYVMPAVIEAHTATENAALGMLYAIPVIIIVALLSMAVYVFARR